MTTDEDQLRALFGTLADRQPATGTDGAWLRERWRRRQARRAGIAAMAVVVAVAGAGVLLLPEGGSEPSLVASPEPSPAGSPTSSAAPSPTPSRSPYPAPPLLDQRTEVRLLVVQGTRLSLLDVDSGRVEAWPTDPRLADNDRLDATRIGGEVVLVPDNSTGAGGGGGTVFATTQGPGSRLRAIGSSDPYLQASARAGRIWLSSAEDTNTPRTTLTEVDLTGRVSRRVVLADTVGAIPFAGGFLRDALPAADSPGTELVNSEGRRRELWPRMSVVAATPDLVVLSEPCTERCPLLLLIADGSAAPVERRLDVDPSLARASYDRAFSPEKDALFFTTPVSEGGPSALSRLDLGSGRTTRLEGALTATYWPFAPAFSDDGRWMFFSAADGSHVLVYDVRRGRTLRVPGDFRGITSVVAVS